ncbi:NADH-quinone oxidoreductase subunit C [Actinocatenispora thailandica]|uniref:NADH-quinone oxidoreductase subunit C n=1 Tax=Actinocatenispora thailandica TaxID=227318 RepID=UPI003376A27E
MGGEGAETGAMLAGRFGADAVGTDSGGGEWARPTVDVPADRWVAALSTARDELGYDFFDWLSAVDEGADGFRVVAHVWSVAGRRGLLLRTLVPADAPVLASVVDVYPGAGWHERETHEMFGVGFAGNPDLAPLLLPDGFEGHPLRKDFVLAARVVKAWPGAKEPGGEHGKRAPMRPPGVPAPDEWPAPRPGTEPDSTGTLPPGASGAARPGASGAAEPPSGEGE